MPFIVFEGLDGSGKSTLMQSLSQELKSQNLPVTTTREPGGTPLGEQIRNLLLKNGKDAPTAWTELFLYEACRRQNVDHVIRPSLEKGHWVLCDRFWASTSAFQSGGRNLDEDKVLQINQWATDGLNPDLWVYMDLPLEEAQKRWENRTSFHPLDRFEMEKLSFHEKVRDYYNKMTKSQKYGPWLVLNATQSTETLVRELIQELKKRAWL
ncbi:MAG: dTMP kinase [Bdellovibrionales bacterium]|nr:dTMP kinase [Bdellovibrionales bacterium]